MDILVICTESSERAERFERFVRDKGHQAWRIAPSDRLPAETEQWLGAVFFDAGSSDVPPLLRERLRYLSVPLLVVTSQEKLDIQADLICDPGTPDPLLFKELQARCLAQPVMPEVRARLVEPFTTAVCQTLSEMTGAEVIARSVYQRPAPAALGDIAATLTLSPPMDGVLILSFSKATAEALEKRILSTVGSGVHPTLLEDCMGEIANVVAGQAKAQLAGTPYHFSFSPPLVSAGDRPIDNADYLDSLVMAFESDLGGLALALVSK